ncbi:MAG: hypothetical protein JST85_20475 [Acidobacteria bacterium]|nr:hypothetical protein [Acidobacteriota bacterium]
MNRFEDELKNALRREEPSADFTDRLMARIAAEAGAERQKDKEKEGRRDWWQTVTALFQPPQMKWAMAGAMAALLIASVVGVNRYREYREEKRQAEIAAEAEGQRAKEQVMFAMRIASAKLNVAQKKVKDTLQHDDGK